MIGVYEDRPEFHIAFDHTDSSRTAYCICGWTSGRMGLIRMYEQIRKHRGLGCESALTASHDELMTGGL